MNEIENRTCAVITVWGLALAKMETCRQQSEDEKYVVAIGHCQPEDADVDGKLLAGSPHQVLEGFNHQGVFGRSRKGYIFIRSANEKAVSLTGTSYSGCSDIYGLLREKYSGHFLRFRRRVDSVG